MAVSVPLMNSIGNFLVTCRPSDTKSCYKEFGRFNHLESPSSDFTRLNAQTTAKEQNSLNEKLREQRYVHNNVNAFKAFSVLIMTAACTALDRWAWLKTVI